MTNFYFSKVKFFPNPALHYLLAAILITLPLKNIFTSVATILFVGGVLFFNPKNANKQNAFLWPIAYFVLMALSLLWSTSFADSVSGLQKQLSMFFIPMAFFFSPEFTTPKVKDIIKLFSYGMVFFALVFLLEAAWRYFQTHNTEVFFHKELVPEDPGVIYISVFASLAFFYFIQISNKSNVEQLCVGILCLLIFLLSSKSIITIDFIIVICYYAFFVKISSGTKTLTIVSVTIFLFLSVFYVKEVRERFLIEYETAFIDNTLNNELTKDQQNVYNVSINEAWNKEDFHKNSFFPGTALRIYQLRIFGDLLREQEIFWKGFGLEASQPYIREKAEQHNLDDIYKEYNFHNQYIQTFAELGIVGFSILVFMLALNLKKALAHKDFLHIAFAITMIMLFLSESFFCRQRGIVFFIVLYCLFNSGSNAKAAIKST